VNKLNKLGISYYRLCQCWLAGDSERLNTQLGLKSCKVIIIVVLSFVKGMLLMNIPC